MFFFSKTLSERRKPYHRGDVAPDVQQTYHRFTNMPGPAGTAFDGSVWVTATSSVAMVLGSVGLVVVAGNLAARRVADGALTLPSMNAKDAREGMIVSASSSRSRPLRKVDGAERVDVVDEDKPSGP